MSATSLTTVHTERGMECRFADGETVAIIAYHSHGLHEVWPSDAIREMAPDAFRICDGMEAAKFYTLCLASELRRWRGDCSDRGPKRPIAQGKAA